MINGVIFFILFLGFSFIFFGCGLSIAERILNKFPSFNAWLSKILEYNEDEFEEIET